MTEQPPEEYPDVSPVLRLVFTVERGAVELADVQQVEMRVPATSSLEDRAEVSGSWVEVTDADGAPVFRHDLAPSLLDGAEVFPEDPYGEIVRVADAPGRRAFSVVVPIPPDTGQVVVAGSPRRGVRAPAGELARFDAQDVLGRARR